MTSSWWNANSQATRHIWFSMYRLRTFNSNHVEILTPSEAIGHHKVSSHDDIFIWNYFPCQWTFVRRIQRLPVDSPHKGQWRRALMFSLISAWTNGWENNQDAGNLRRHRVNYNVNVMNIVLGNGDTKSSSESPLNFREKFVQESTFRDFPMEYSCYHSWEWLKILFFKIISIFLGDEWV